MHSNDETVFASVSLWLKYAERCCFYSGKYSQSVMGYLFFTQGLPTFMAIVKDVDFSCTMKHRSEENLPNFASAVSFAILSYCKKRGEGSSVRVKATAYSDVVIWRVTLLHQCLPQAGPSALEHRGVSF